MNEIAMATTHHENLWRVEPDPKRAGMFFALAQTRLGQIVRLTSSNRALLEQEMIQMQVPDEGEDLFLAAWKRGVTLAGRNLFTCDHGQQPVHDVDDATNKWQLIPDWDLIEKALLKRSAWDSAFLASMCSFYNSEWGAKLLQRVKLGSTRRPRTMGHLAYGLDAERREVLADLLVNYRGW